ncbi:MAG: hypothetical protein ACREFJ_06045 [Acetobacteraceae bacterium]
MNMGCRRRVRASPGADDRPQICLSARGRRFDQKRAASLAAGSGVVLLAGRHEGIDQRAIDARGLEEISVGDYVLPGGEPAAMILLDAVVRPLPGVMGSDASLAEESFSTGILEYSHCTPPPSGRAGRCPPCCSPAITPRSPLGAAPRPSARPASTGPILDQ